jgi:hypothetical protein
MIFGIKSKLTAMLAAMQHEHNTPGIILPTCFPNRFLTKILPLSSTDNR